MSNIRDSLEHLLKGNLDEMRNSLNAGLNERALVALQEKKTEIAQSIFTSKE